MEFEYKIEDTELREACGIFGCVAAGDWPTNLDVAHIIYMGLIALQHSSACHPSLLNLVYRALKKDVASIRVKAFVKRLLQISLYQAPNLQCGILMLLSAISKVHPTLLETKHHS